jgi:hypothetical protein
MAAAFAEIFAMNYMVNQGRHLPATADSAKEIRVLLIAPDYPI